MNKPLFALSVLSAFLVGVLVGPWLRPQPQPVPPIVEAPPPPPQVESKPPPLEPPPPAAAAAEAELQLKGVFVGADASRSRALITYDDSSPKPYKLDEKLPDGSVLKAVGNRSIEVERDGQTRTLPLTRGSNADTELEALTPEEAVPAPPPENPAAADVPSPSVSPAAGSPAQPGDASPEAP